MDSEQKALAHIPLSASWLGVFLGNMQDFVRAVIRDFTIQQKGQRDEDLNDVKIWVLPSQVQMYAV